MGKNVSKEDIHSIYTIKETLGKGNFAAVKHAKRKKDGKEFAVKIIKKTKLEPAELAVVHDEVEIMHKVDHPNCVRLYEIFENEKKLYLVMELLTGGELFDRIVQQGSFSEREAASVVSDIASAMKYLHGIGVVHRDLKPENLIYKDKTKDSQTVITDFGLAKFLKTPAGIMKTQCGTPGYVAPEVLKGEPYHSQVDLWSLGVILYILLCGFPPFYAENNDTRKLYKQIKAGQYEFPDEYWGPISDQAKDLVRRLLVVDPKKRYTAADVLKHPWVFSKNASTSKFSAKHQERLKQHQARSKLRKAVDMILVVNKFRTAIVTHVGQPMGGKPAAEEAKAD